MEKPLRLTPELKNTTRSGATVRHGEMGHAACTPGSLAMACVLTGFLAAGSALCAAQAQPQENANLLVRETVYNELHDHQQHGYWRYWVESHGVKGTRIEEQVETADGPVGRVLLRNGQRLDREGEQLEKAKLEELLNSPEEQASKRQAYREDEERISRVLALLPDAFTFQDAGTEDGVRHLRYSPNPNYSTHSMEAKVFHELSGEIWIDTRAKRLRRLDGHLNDNVEFGFGMLGKVNKGSWFRLVRQPVGHDEWKTERLEVHLSGKALLFKTIAHETSEVRGGFEVVPPAMSLKQGLGVLEHTVNQRLAAMEAGSISPAAWMPVVPGGQ